MTKSVCKRTTLPAVAVAVAVAVAAGLCGEARADCESGILALSQAMRTVTDPHITALLQTDLRGAEVELWEFDEVECATVLAHAARLLADPPRPHPGAEPTGAVSAPAAR